MSWKAPLRRISPASLKKMFRSNGPNTVPWNTISAIGKSCDFLPPITTVAHRPRNHDERILKNLGRRPTRRFDQVRVRRDIAQLGLIHRSVLLKGPPHFKLLPPRIQSINGHFIIYFSKRCQNEPMKISDPDFIFIFFVCIESSPKH